MFANSALPAPDSNAARNEAPQTRASAQIGAAQRAPWSIELSCLDRLLAEIIRHRETLRAEPSRLPQQQASARTAKPAKPRRNASLLTVIAPSLPQR